MAWLAGRPALLTEIVENDFPLPGQGLSFEFDA